MSDRWLWIDECGDPWDDDWIPVPRIKYRRYCPSCGQVVTVKQAEGEVYIPRHLVAEKDGNMTTCVAGRTTRVLEPAP